MKENYIEDEMMIEDLRIFERDCSSRFNRKITKTNDLISVRESAEYLPGFSMIRLAKSIT